MPLILALAGAQDSRYASKGARVLCCNQKQRAGGTRRRTPPLLPLLQRTHGYAQQLGKPGLSQPRAFSNLRDGWNGDDSPVFAALDLADALKNL